MATCASFVTSSCASEKYADTAEQQNHVKTSAILPPTEHGQSRSSTGVSFFLAKHHTVSLWSSKTLPVLLTCGVTKPNYNNIASTPSRSCAPSDCVCSVRGSVPRLVAVPTREPVYTATPSNCLRPSGPRLVLTAAAWPARRLPNWVTGNRSNLLPSELHQRLRCN